MIVAATLSGKLTARRSRASLREGTTDVKLADTPSSSTFGAGRRPAPIAFGPFLLDRANARLLPRRPAGRAHAQGVRRAAPARQPARPAGDQGGAAVERLAGRAGERRVGEGVRARDPQGAGGRRRRPAVHRDGSPPGVRFIGHASTPDAGRPPQPAAAPAAVPAARAGAVGRPLAPGAADRRGTWRCDILRDRFDRAAAGTRQCLFVTGGPGSGKTALVESFIRALESTPTPARSSGGRSCCGHCFEQFGTGEPYMPVWEAIGRLAREQPGSGVAALLERHAAARQVGARERRLLRPRKTSSPTPSTRPRTATATAQRAARHVGPAAARDDRRARGARRRRAARARAGRRALGRLLDARPDLAPSPAGGTRPRGCSCSPRTAPPSCSAGEHPLRDVVHGLLAASLARELPLPFLDEPAVAEYLDRALRRGGIPAGACRAACTSAPTATRCSSSTSSTTSSSRACSSSSRDGWQLAGDGRRGGKPAAAARGWRCWKRRCRTPCGR